MNFVEPAGRQNVINNRYRNRYNKKLGPKGGLVARSLGELVARTGYCPPGGFTPPPKRWDYYYQAPFCLFVFLSLAFPSSPSPSLPFVTFFAQDGPKDSKTCRSRSCGLHLFSILLKLKLLIENSDLLPLNIKETIHMNGSVSYLSIKQCLSSSYCWSLGLALGPRGREVPGPERDAIFGKIGQND